MPIISKYPLRLQKLVDHASRRMNKPIQIKTNDILEYVRERGVSYPSKSHQLNPLPVYVNSSPQYVDKGKLTDKGEYSCAHEIMHYLIFKDGYQEMSIKGAAFNKREMGKIGERALGFIFSRSQWLKTVHNFSLHLMTENCLKYYGYEVEKYAKDSLFEQFQPDLKRHFSDSNMSSIGNQLDFNLLANPEVARLFIFDELHFVASNYLSLTDAQRTDFLSLLGTFWKDQLFGFLKHTDCNFEYAFRMGPAFTSYYTPKIFQETYLKTFDWLGCHGKYFIPTEVPIIDHEDMLLKESTQLLKEGECFAAFKVLMGIHYKDISKEIDRTERLMLEKVTETVPWSTIEERAQYVAFELLKINEVDGATQFLEDYNAERTNPNKQKENDRDFGNNKLKEYNFYMADKKPLDALNALLSLPQFSTEEKEKTLNMLLSVAASRGYMIKEDAFSFWIKIAQVRKMPTAERFLSALLENIQNNNKK